MAEYLKVNRSATALSMYNELRDHSAFQDASLTESEIRSWLNTARPRLKIRPPATLKDVQDCVAKQLTPWTVIGGLGDDDPLCLELTRTENVVSGPDIRKITGDAKPKTTPGGLQYAFCIPGTTKRLFSRVLASREQIYLEFEKITVEDGPIFKEIKSKGVLLGDGVYQMVEGNVAVVIRLLTVNKNGKRRRTSFGIGSGETSWVASSLYLSFQRLAELLYGFSPNEPFMGWNVCDDGPGLTKGLSIWLSSVKKGYLLFAFGAVLL
jgi:hypothetical protein